MVTWWYGKANKVWFRILALVVSSVFFFTQIVGASVPDSSFWAERYKTRQKLLASRGKPLQTDSPRGFGEKLEEKDVAGEVSSLITPHNLFTIPSQYGAVKEVHTEASSNKGKGMGNRLIIHIQDAHSSPEAQLNSANILKYISNNVSQTSGVSSESLTNRHCKQCPTSSGRSPFRVTKNGETIVSHSKPLLICVEGSSGLVDTTLLSSFPEKKIKEEVASEFLKEGKITGEEYFAITGGEKVPVVNIYGVEDKRAYEKNLKAFEEGVSSGERVRNYLQKVRKEINPLKARLYNKRLKELESKIETYQEKKISLSQYCQYLYRLLDDTGSMNRTPTESDVGATFMAPEKEVRGKYPNFELFVQASQFEEKIDFSRVDSERSKYIKELSGRLTSEELSDLLIMSLDYRLGKVTSGEYYTYLQSLSTRMGKGMRSEDPRILTELVTSKEGKNEYPNLNLYIKYNKLYDKIDQNRLFSEISELEEELKLRLCEREEEKKLAKLSRILGVLQDLLSLKISNEDLAYYYKHRDEITPGMFSEELLECKAKALQGSNSRLTLHSFDTPDEFLECKAKALLKFEEFYRIALNRNEALVDNTISRMEAEGVRVAVLIAGGFHTPGITELLRDRNISYVVVTPRLGEDSSSDLELSPRKKRTDLEKAIAGIVGALRPANILGEESFQTCSVIHLSGRTLILYSQFEPREIENAFNELGEKWRAELADRPELSKVVKNVDFLPVVLTRGREAFALGVATGKNGKLPFVIQYNVGQKKVSEVIYGEDNCRKFLLTGSFDNAQEVNPVVYGELSEVWNFLSDVPEEKPENKSEIVSDNRESVPKLMGNLTPSNQIHTWSVAQKLIEGSVEAFITLISFLKKWSLSLVSREYIHSSFDTAFGGRKGKKSKGSGLASRTEKDLPKEELLKIFENDEVLLNQYIEKAARAKGISEKDVIKGMFHASGGKIVRRELQEVLPDEKKTILAFGGGTGLLASIKPLHRLGAFVRSIQCSVDDGGATFKMINSFIKKGFGWIPSVGDLVNSLFKGFASQDKLYKLLDDQGRIVFEKEKIVFYDEDGKVAYLDSFKELIIMLLQRIVKYTIGSNKKGIGYAEKTTDLGDDFVYFAASILNLADIIEEKYFAKKIIDKEGASIRNLLLLAAMDYLGLIDVNSPPYKDKSLEEKMTYLLNEREKETKFQQALDLLAELANIKNGRVSLSHNIPVTVYCIYRDNVILIGDKNSVLATLIVNKDKNRIEVKIPDNYNETHTLTQFNPVYKVKTGNLEVTLKRTKDGDFAFAINRSGDCILREPQNIEDNSVKYGDEKDQNIATDGTGRVRYNTDKPDVYEYKPLHIGGYDVYVRSRFAAMQTNITETANYSKIVDFGVVAEVTEKDWENVGGEQRPIYKPDPEKKIEPNSEIIEAINNPGTQGIIFGPGSLFTSLLPHLLVEGLPEALAERRKKGDIPIVFAINPTIDNETAKFSLEDILEFVKKKTGYRIDELFTDLVINKFDTTKLEQHRKPTMPAETAHLSASWYVEKVLESNNLIYELGLGYFIHLLKKCLPRIDLLRSLLSTPSDPIFPVGNDKDKRISVREYLEAKFQELLDTLYQKPKFEIRKPGSPSDEAKKSRGPLSYTREEINRIKNLYPRLNIHSNVFLGGVEFVPTRKPAEKAKPHIGFLDEYTSYLLGEIFGLTAMDRTITQKYDELVKQEQKVPEEIKNNEDDCLEFVYSKWLKDVDSKTSIFSEKEEDYFLQLGLDGFKRVVRDTHMRDRFLKPVPEGFKCDEQDTRVKIEVSGGRYGINESIEKGEFKEGQKDKLVNALNRFLARSRRGPKEVTVIITTDTDYVIDTNLRLKTDEKLPEETIFIHPYFFELSEEERSELLYNKLVSHILNQETDEGRASEDTQRFKIAPYALMLYKQGLAVLDDSKYPQGLSLFYRALSSLVFERAVGEVAKKTLESLRSEIKSRASYVESNPFFGLDSRLVQPVEKPVVNEKTGEVIANFKDERVNWLEAHSEGIWHANSQVLVMDQKGRVWIQKRGDKEGKKDLSVTGHLHKGEDFGDATLRLIKEQMGLSSPKEESLIRLEGVVGERKVGERDYTSKPYYDKEGVFHSLSKEKINREYCRLYLYILSPGELNEIESGGLGQELKEALGFELYSLEELIQLLRSFPEQFGSSALQLLYSGDNVEIVKRELKSRLVTATATPTKEEKLLPEIRIEIKGQGNIQAPGNVQFTWDDSVLDNLKPELIALARERIYAFQDDFIAWLATLKDAPPQDISCVVCPMVPSDKDKDNNETHLAEVRNRNVYFTYALFRKGLPREFKFGIFYHEVISHLKENKTDEAETRNHTLAYYQDHPEILFPTIATLDKRNDNEITDKEDWLSSLEKAIDIFKPQDIRAKDAERYLSDFIVKKVARAYANILKKKLDKDELNVVVGRDVRASSPRIQKTLIDTLLSLGMKVIDIGIAPTPLMYFAAAELFKADGGINVTGSHTSAEQNGMKLIYGTDTISGEEILDEIIVQEIDSLSNKAEEAYIKKRLIDLAEADLSKMTIVIENFHGTTGFLEKIFKRKGAEVFSLHTWPKEDGTFSVEEPDPNEKNLGELKKKVLEQRADLGIAFDSDGDRVGFVTANGRFLTGNQLLAILSIYTRVKKGIKGIAIFNSKTSEATMDAVRKKGIEAFRWWTGYTHQRALAKELNGVLDPGTESGNAKDEEQKQRKEINKFRELIKNKKATLLLAGEESGHVIFPENNYFDDGMYTAIRLLNILARGKKTLDELIEKLPTSHYMPDTRLKITDEVRAPELKEQIEEKIAEHFKNEGLKIEWLDGPKIYFRKKNKDKNKWDPYEWVLIRHSETEPKMSVTAEARTEKNLKENVFKVWKKLSKYPTLDLKKLEDYLKIEEESEKRTEKTSVLGLGVAALLTFGLGLWSILQIGVPNTGSEWGLFVPAGFLTLYGLPLLGTFLTSLFIVPFISLEGKKDAPGLKKIVEESIAGKRAKKIVYEEFPGWQRFKVARVDPENKILYINKRWIVESDLAFINRLRKLILPIILAHEGVHFAINLSLRAIPPLIRILNEIPAYSIMPISFLKKWILGLVSASDVQGRHFHPQRNFIQGKPLDKSLIRTTRKPKEVLALLREAKKQGIKLSITGHLRGLDGPGSSLDLPEFQLKLTRLGAKSLEELPSTPTIASEFSVKIRFELADNEDAIEYIAPDYTYPSKYDIEEYQEKPIDKDHICVRKGKVELNKQGRTHWGQLDAPAFIFRNIFGLRGIKIICEEISPMALAGGMESSNVFNVALIAAASTLSGADLSLADVFNLAVKIENDEFGGLTGGQGHICCLVGGAYRHVWLSGMKDKQGRLVNPYSAFSIPLLSEKQLSLIEKNVMLAQAGKEYEKGKPAGVGRTAALINNMWTDLLRDKDEIGFPLHQEKLGLTALYTQALKEGNFKTVVETINRYVEIRDQLCLRWINLMLDASQGKTVPEYAKNYADKVFNRENPEYNDYGVIREMYEKERENLRKISLYTLEPIATLARNAREEGIAIMPLGAGGPGSNLIAVSPEGTEHLRKFFKNQGLPKLTEEGARKIIRGTGILKGYMPFKVGKEPIGFEGFKELRLEVPELPDLGQIHTSPTDMQKPTSALKKYLDAIPPASESSIKLVIFDWGNVITRYDYRIPAKKLAKRFAVSEGLASTLFEERNTNPDNIFYKYEKGKINEEQLIEEIKTWLKQNSSLEEIELTKKEFEEIYNSIWIGDIPETIALIKVLKEKGYKIRILTTTNNIHYVYDLTRSAVVGLLEDREKDIYASHLRGISKPDKRSYLQVVDDAGLSSEQCLFIDDRQDCVDGAKSAGLKAYQFSPGDVIGSIKGIADTLSTTHPSPAKGRPVGRLLDPGKLIISGRRGKEAVEYRPSIKRDKLRKSEEVSAFLKKAGGITFEGPLRGLDFGSSQDLQALKELLTPREVKNLSEIAATTIFASKFRGKIRVEAVDDKDKDKIVYVARIYGLREEKPRIFTEEIKLVENKLTGKWETPKGQPDAIGYILWTLFGLKGIKVTYDLYYPGDTRRGIERVPQVGGMGTSGSTNTGLYMIGSVLSGADLSIADIVAEATIAENEHFKGYTGGQEAYSSILGGAQNVIWPGGIKDKDGNLMNHPFSAFATEVCTDEEHFKFMEDHVVLVQPGVMYAEVEDEEGKLKIEKQAHRSASCINTMWMQLARVKRDKATGEDIPVDPVGAGYHRNKIEHGNKQVQGVIEKKIELINGGNIGYVKERDSLCLREMQLILEGEEERGISPKKEWLNEFSISDRIGIATYVPKREGKGLLTQEEVGEIKRLLEPILKKEEAKEEISEKEQELVNGYAIENIQRLYKNKISLYSDYAQELLDAVGKVNEEEGEAYMSAIPLGAGGDGGIVALFSKGGKEHLEEFLAKLGLPDLTENPGKVEKVVTETGGMLKGWMPYEIARKGFELGFDNMDSAQAKKEGYIIPELPQPVEYNEKTASYAVRTLPGNKLTSFLWLFLFGGVVSLFMNSLAFGQEVEEVGQGIGEHIGAVGLEYFLVPLILGGIVTIALIKKWGQLCFSWDYSVGLRVVWQALKSLFEGAQKFVAAIFHKPSKRKELRMSWLGPQEELSQEKIREIMELARQLLVKEGFYQENPEISQLLGWTSLPEQMAGEVGRIEKFARMVRRSYERVVVIGEEARQYAEVAAAIAGERRGYPEISVLKSTRPEAVRKKMESEINLEKTLFVVSSAEPVEYLYEKLTQFYKARGTSVEEIVSQIGKHFVAIAETNAPFAEEASKREFLRTFNVPEGISGSSAMFSEGALFTLALAGVDIKGFVENGIKGMEICREENPEENLAVRLAGFQEAMRETGREIVLVLPEELEGLGEVWQEVISPLGKEGKQIISITEKELTAGRRFGEKTAFIRLKVERQGKTLAIEKLREAEYPVFEISLRGREAIGSLFYVAGFATALSYLMGIEGFGKPAGGETSLPAEAVVGRGLEKGTIGTEITMSESLLEHLVSRLKALRHESTKVFVFDLGSALKIKTESEATASGMSIEFKVTPNSTELLRFMGEIVEAAKQTGNPYGVKFAFVSNTRNLRKEVIETMLRDYLVENGLTPDAIGNILNDGLIIDRATEGIVDPSGRISAKRVCSYITEKLLGRTDGNGIEFNIITADEAAWKRDIDERMMKKVLWMVLEPAKEGQALATAEGLVVAIEGKASRWLEKFIRSRYPEDEAARLLSQIEDGQGKIMLPARAVDKDYLEGIKTEEKIYKVQA